jgi:hypothetical protein
MTIFETVALAFAIVGVAFVGLWVLARYFAKSLSGDADTVAGRQTAIQIGTNAFLALSAVGTVTALIFTARSADAALESADAARASVEATRDGQITERYTRAVEQLYANSRGVRTRNSTVHSFTVRNSVVRGWMAWNFTGRTSRTPTSETRV